MAAKSTQLNRRTYATITGDALHIEFQPPGLSDLRRIHLSHAEGRALAEFLHTHLPDSD